MSSYPKGHGISTEGYTKVKGHGIDKTLELLEYIDGAASFSTSATNNRSELYAVTAFLEHLDQSGDGSVTQVHVLSDSRYVVDGCNKWAKNWVNAGWRRQNSDGSVGDIPNRDDWAAFWELKTALEQSGVRITFGWVKGHSNNIGNSRADYLSVVGRRMSAAGTKNNVCNETSPIKYWSKRSLLKPLMPKFIDAMSGEYISGTDTPYYKGGRNATSITLRASKSPDMAMLNLQQELFDSDRYQDMSLHVSNALLPFPTRDLSVFGEYALGTRSGASSDYAVHGRDDSVVIMDPDPAALANRYDLEFARTGIALAASVMFKMYNSFSTKRCSVVDITEHFYDAEKLKDLPSTITCSFNTSAGLESRQLTIVPGLTVPTLGSLADVESIEPSVYLVYIEGDFHKKQYVAVDTEDVFLITCCPTIELS